MSISPVTNQPTATSTSCDSCSSVAEHASRVAVYSIGAPVVLGCSIVSSALLCAACCVIPHNAGDGECRLFEEIFMWNKQFYICLDPCDRVKKASFTHPSENAALLLEDDNDL